MASQGYHHHHHHHHHQAAAGIFSFSNGFERSAINHQEQQQQLVQQIRRDKLRVQGFEPPPPPPLVGIEEEESNALPVYESTGMLSSEMFYFPSSVTVTAASTELLDQSLQANYRGQLGESKNDRDSLAQQQQLPSINADSAAAMHLFLMNPQTRSPSPPPPQPQPPPRGFHGGAFPPQFIWVPDNSHEGGHGQGQGLSLSLSSLQHLEAAKLYYNQGGATGGADGGGGSSATATAQFQYKHDHHSPHQPLGLVQNHQVHVGYNSSLGMVNVLRNSKYTKPAQELLEEFCSVGSGRFKKKKLGKNNINPSSNPSNDGTTTNGSSSSTKDLPPFSASDRIEHQRRKVKLLSMLDEVDRRYNHYCEQMQTVVNSFDLVMGYGAAIPYTALAQKAMSRHFRCLKDAISSQLKHSCELLGEKDGVGTSGITKGETPRLRMLEQSLRQQKAFHQIGMMEHEAWRPQRGLPERSVNILRAWLFEHFLHPYPSDADKHLLARQTGLSRNQVSNWFINARVRLWKPMVEEMYQQESKEGGDNNKGTRTNNNAAQTSTPSTTAVGGAGGASPPPQPPENDPSLIGTNTTQCFFENQLTNTGTSTTNTSTATEVTPPVSDSDIHQRLLAVTDDTCHRGSNNIVGTITADNTDIGSTLIRFGTTGGDVSLTLGLRHAGNMPDKASSFSVTDFGGC
ncbi:hypothetical protein E1A91_A02G181400v1 [Gossypium mustelinum]|uniref:Homeobox domain-containing protein n=2 Tax=Gossypium mustelinum TaxID=34275 RepID=A0A5D3A8V5_GOSMU|nr:hypothetical protein E1A91_A02G181400v1 [Gossypium mustelinum]